MNHWSAVSPILLTAALSLLSPSFSFAEPGVPSESSTPPSLSAPVSSPAPTVTPAPPALPPSSSSIPEMAAATPSTYTVKKGDSWWSIAHRAGCTVNALKKYNHVTWKSPKTGELLMLPPATVKVPKPSPTTKPSTTNSKPKKSSSTQVYAKAQPVQDFDVPASTFASCPVPVASPETDAPAPSTTTDTPETAAPVAKLVSPGEYAQETAPSPTPPAPALAKTAPVKKTPTPLPPAPSGLASNAFTLLDTAPDDASSAAAMTYPTSSSKQGNRGYAPLVAATAPLPSDLSNRFLEQARWLGDRGLSYNEDWRPPGESHAWVMDCSNTARYLYKSTVGLNLPRTASDQYYYLHLQGKAWDVPQASNGYADCNFLRRNLKVGDLLFWENTYRPERQPPITHVMVFLGTNDRGSWIMAGSQSSRGGEHNRRHGGPDIYVFDPTQPCGGYTTWLGFVHHKGRFCAFGRPLEADPSKLSVATTE